ncbi:MAG: hypothetical protein ACOC0A_05655 [Planctomycetota bacterium]
MKQQWKVAAAVIVILVAGVGIYMQLGGGPKMPRRSFYYDVDNEEVFVAERGREVPFERENGGQAVKVEIRTCSEDWEVPGLGSGDVLEESDEWFIAALKRPPTEEEYREWYGTEKPPSGVEELYKLPDDDGWVRASNFDRRTRCPDSDDIAHRVFPHGVER